MKQKKRLKLVRTDALAGMPGSVRELANRAIHSTGYYLDGATPTDWDYETIEGLIQQCVDLAGEEKLTGPRGDPHTWLIVLYMLIHASQAEISERWPSLSFEFNGKVETKTIYERLFAAVALWRIDLALGCTKKGDYEGAIAEVANAGLAMNLSGLAGAGELSKLNQVTLRRKGGKARWAAHPTHAVATGLRAEWEKWQAGEARYENDEHFARQMHAKFGAFKNERSIANRSRKWRKESASS